MHTFRTPLLALAIAFLAIPALAAAAEFVTGDQPSIAANRSISNDLYIFGGNVSIAGAVTGDAVAAGGSVLVSGNVSEDLMIVGGNATVLGNVGDDLRAVGGNIVVSGSVAGDVIVGGGQIQLAGEGIGGDLAAGAGTLRLETPVEGNAKIAGGDIYINALVAGDLDVQADKITLGPEARIAGSFVYSSPREAVLEEGAVVVGETEYTKMRGNKVSKGDVAAIISLALLTKFLMHFIAALVLVLVFTRYGSELVARAASKPLSEMARGVVFLIVTPVLSVILMVTVLGLPLGLLGMLAFAVVMVFAWIVAPIVLGSLVDKWVFKQGYRVNWKTVLLGVVLYVLVGLIPILGALVKLVLILLVVGAMLNIKWQLAKEWR